MLQGQCGDWNWNIPLHLPRRMHIQSAFYYQQWIVCLLIQEMKVTETLNMLTSLHHVSHDTCKMHGKRHQDTVFWVDIELSIKGGLTFYQTRSNAITLQGTLPAHCIPKVERLKTGEMLY